MMMRLGCRSRMINPLVQPGKLSGPTTQDMHALTRQIGIEVRIARLLDESVIDRPRCTLLCAQ